MTTDIAEAPLSAGLRTTESEFYTEHFIITGSVTSPELRLSDHLNGSSSMFEVSCTSMCRIAQDAMLFRGHSQTYVSKAHLLFVVPLVEPSVLTQLPADHRAPTVTHRCWAALAQYELVGSAHMDATNDPRLFLRSLEKRKFLPFTDVELTLSDGTVREHPVVMVNRQHIQLLAVESDGRKRPEQNVR